MVITQRKLLALVGLHGSGKTSFLAALWAVVEEGLVDGALRLHAVPDNSGYLNKILANWLRCISPKHTPTGSLEHVELELEDEHGRVLIMSAPDLSGETYREMFSTREMSSDLVRLIEGSWGILLVIHPDQATEAKPIDDANAELDELEIPDDEAEDPPEASSDGADNNVTDAEEDNEEGESANKFTRDKVVAQVKIVDVLQAFSWHVGSAPRIAVLVSAWDLVEPLGKSPREWLADALPFLSQYVEGLEKIAIFGLSAQGGEFRGDTAEALCKTAPIERPRVVPETGQVSNDVTLPLRWLLEE